MSTTHLESHFMDQLKAQELSNFLDAQLENGEAEAAFEVERAAMAHLDTTPSIPNYMALLAFKAVSIAQYARQETRSTDKDNTYHNLGTILNKTLSTANWYGERNATSVEYYLRHRKLVGTLAEIAVYTLLAYNSEMTHSLTRRPRDIPSHYTLPASRDEDHGNIYYFDRHHRTGFDLKLFTDNPDERVLPIQVKSSRKILEFGKPYAPGIITVTLDEILPENNKDDETRLARLLGQDASGHYDRQMKLNINSATRNLDRLIIAKSIGE